MKADLRSASFEEFLAFVFEKADHEADLLVDPALQIAHAEKLFRDAARAAAFPEAAREKGLLYLVSLSQPEFFGRQLWNHAVPLGARVSCAARHLSLPAPPPSTSGPGRGPFKAVARVRIPPGAFVAGLRPAPRRKSARLRLA